MENGVSGFPHKPPKEIATMRIIRPAVASVRYRDLPHMETHVSEEAGFSIYRGVVVRWDEDYDDRILNFIDTLDDSIVCDLVAVQEHEGTISFRWRTSVPIEFSESQSVAVPDGDCWLVCESRVIGADD